jgi:hypothetical protein
MAKSGLKLMLLVAFRYFDQILVLKFLSKIKNQTIILKYKICYELLILILGSHRKTLNSQKFWLYYSEKYL